MVKVEYITARMKELDIASGEKLAELAGVSRQTVWNLLNSKHTPELKTVIAVAKALDIHWTELIEEEAAA